MTIPSDGTIPSRLARLDLVVVRPEEQWPADTSGAGRLLDAWGLTRSPQEAIWVIAYDASSSLRTVVEVARGGYIHVDLHIPSLLAAVLVTGSERFVVAHNHQNGTTRPSTQDIEMTRLIEDAAVAVGLYLEDHLIVASGVKTFSLREAGLHEPYPYGGAKNRLHQP